MKLTEDSDAFWECYIRVIAGTVFHGSGTCKMGRLGDNDTVVDPRLRLVVATTLESLEPLVVGLLITLNKVMNESLTISL